MALRVVSTSVLSDTQTIREKPIRFELKRYDHC